MAQTCFHCVHTKRKQAHVPVLLQPAKIQEMQLKKQVQDKCFDILSHQLCGFLWILVPSQLKKPACLASGTNAEVEKHNFPFHGFSM